jgi:uncharacterized membrane protein YecN with MAPEG domain
MVLIICFLLGIVNFALHRAVVESGHPFVEDTKKYFGRFFGSYSSYIIEFIILIGVLLLASSGPWIVALVYFCYSVINILAAWMLLTEQI